MSRLPPSGESLQGGAGGSAGGALTEVEYPMPDWVDSKGASIASPGAGITWRHRLVAVLTIGLLGFGGLFAMRGAFPTAAFAIPLQEVIEPTHFLPQGWSFFTRSPREENVAIWQRDDDDVYERGQIRNMSADNVFGLGRQSRTQGVHLSLIGTAAGGAGVDFVACGDVGDRTERTATVARCLRSLDVTEVGLVPGIPDDLCGDVYLVAHEPQPWAWFAEGVGEDMPARALGVAIECPERDG